MTRPPSISVVIAARNEERRIPRCLASVLAQDPPPLETIVVDDASNDRTADVAAALGAHVVRLTSRQGAGGARDAGVRVARSPIVAFVDADDEVEPGWTAALERAFEGGAEVVAGRITVGPEDSAARRFWRRHPEGHDLDAKNGFLPRLVTGNLALRRSIFLDVGGFHPGPVAGEDTDLSWRLALEGHTFTYSGDAVVRFTPPKSVLGLVRRASRRGFAASALAWRYRLFEFPFLWVRRGRWSLSRGVAVGLARAATSDRRRIEVFTDAALQGLMQAVARWSFKLGHVSILMGARRSPVAVVPPTLGAKSAATPLPEHPLAIIGVTETHALRLAVALNSASGLSAAPPGLGAAAVARWDDEPPWSMRYVRDARGWRLPVALSAKRLERLGPRAWGASYVALHAVRAWAFGRSAYVIVEPVDVAAEIARRMPDVPYLQLSTLALDELARIAHLWPEVSVEAASALRILRRVPAPVIRMFPA